MRFEGIDLAGKNAIVSGGLFVNNGFIIDSSNGGNGDGGYRSESGPAGFMQGEAGQQRHNGGDNNETRTWRGWSGGSDPISSSDDMPRTTAPTAASRIDYRV